MSKTTRDKTQSGDNPISSEDLAAIIVDALLDVGVVQKKDAVRAIEIATEKIEGRKGIGDY
jgi:hypothetical protein